MRDARVYTLTPRQDEPRVKLDLTLAPNMRRGFSRGQLTPPARRREAMGHFGKKNKKKTPKHGANPTQSEIFEEWQRSCVLVGGMDQFAVNGALIPQTSQLQNWRNEQSKLWNDSRLDSVFLTARCRRRDKNQQRELACEDK